MSALEVKPRDTNMIIKVVIKAISHIQPGPFAKLWIHLVMSVQSVGKSTKPIGQTDIMGQRGTSS